MEKTYFAGVVMENVTVEDSISHYEKIEILNGDFSDVVRAIDSQRRIILSQAQDRLHYVEMVNEFVKNVFPRKCADAFAKAIAFGDITEVQELCN